MALISALSTRCFRISMQQPLSAATCRGVDWCREEYLQQKLTIITNDTLTDRFSQIPCKNKDFIWNIKVISTIVSTISYTYIRYILDVDISTLFNKVFHHILIVFISCHMQRSPLMERNICMSTKYMLL